MIFFFQDEKKFAQASLVSMIGTGRRAWTWEMQKEEEEEEEEKEERVVTRFPICLEVNEEQRALIYDSKFERFATVLNIDVCTSCQSCI